VCRILNNILIIISEMLEIKRGIIHDKKVLSYNTESKITYKMHFYDMFLTLKQIFLLKYFLTFWARHLLIYVYIYF